MFSVYFESSLIYTARLLNIIFIIHYLIFAGIGGLLIAIGVLMIVVKLLTDDDSDLKDKLDKYKPRVGRSPSQNPIIEDVEYGMDSRRSSMNKPIPKHFDEDMSPPPNTKNGVVKV